MSQKPKRLLFAAVDIGWRIELYSKYIIEQFSGNVKVDSLVIYQVPHSHYRTNYTYTYNVQDRANLIKWFFHLYIFITNIFEYDIFYFFSGETLLPRRLRGLEFACYKLLRKKIIMHFVGSDIRSPKYLEWKSNNLIGFLNGRVSRKKTEVWQDKLIQDANEYASEIFVSTPDLLELIPNAKYFPVVIDIEKFTIELPQKRSNKNDEIVILHAPSNTMTKGSKHIHKILYQLQKESHGKIKLLLPALDKIYDSTYSLSRYDLFNLYMEADIVIDQMVIGWYGLQAIEALLCNTKVITYIAEELEEFRFPNCPLINANILNLKDVLNNEIEKMKTSPNRKDITTEWVQKNHSSRILNTYFNNELFRHNI